MERLKAWANIHKTGKHPATALEDDLWEGALEIEAYRELAIGKITKAL